MLASDYSYSVVSSPDYKYLWILSRTPQMEETVYNSIIEELKKRGGFQVNKLKRTVQWFIHLLWIVSILPILFILQNYLYLFHSMEETNSQPQKNLYKEKKHILIYIILRYITKENKKMHVTYAFVYYFLLIVMFKTFMTVFFCIPQVRRLFFSFVTKHKLADSQYVKGIVYLAFAIILIIMADSIMTYVSVRGTMNNGILFNDDRWEDVGSGKIWQYKKIPSWWLPDDVQEKSRILYGRKKFHVNCICTVRVLCVPEIFVRV